MMSVYRLYCVEELTIEQVANKYWCSVGTVANRLKLIKTRMGADPKNLRRVSGHLDRIAGGFGAAKAQSSLYKGPIISFWLVRRGAVSEENAARSVRKSLQDGPGLKVR